jgi:hypothetical protein
MAAAILMWNHSTNTLVDGNTFIDCQREIALGLIERTPNDHSGGIIRNNFIYRRGAGDSAIYVAAGSVSGNHTTATAALFVNAAVGDLHLKPTATALLDRVVTPLVNAAVDWDGQARPAGRTDVGADELLQGTPPSAPQGLRIIR